jgi:hypothetical protein
MDEMKVLKSPVFDFLIITILTKTHLLPSLLHMKLLKLGLKTDSFSEYEKNAKNGDVFSIKKLITYNPLLALSLYEKFHIVNTHYFFLKYFLDDRYSDDGEIFFKKEIKKNVRAVFNYYNYLICHQKELHCSKLLELYFTNRGLAPISKINNIFPMYINNIRCSYDVCKIDMRKKISVIMTVYNCESLVKDSIESLLNQTYKNIEIIIIDDGSSDSTYEVIENLQIKNSSRIHLFRSIRNQGTYVAKNIGLCHASGDLITFHDSDDWAHPQRIEEHVKVHNNQEDVVASISQLVRIQPNGLFFSKEIFPLDRLCLSSLMFDRTVISHIGFFRSGRVGNDSEYFERLKTFVPGKIVKVNKVLTLCAQRPNSLTTNAETGIEAFGVNNKRVHAWKRWRTWHMKSYLNRKKIYVDYNI